MSLLNEYARAERILASIGGELEQRFQDSDAMAEAKLSPLFRSYVELLRIMASAQKSAETLMRPQVINILQLVDNAGIPEGKRVEILVAAIRDIGLEEAEERGLIGALHRIAGGERAQQLLSIEGGRP